MEPDRWPDEDGHIYATGYRLILEMVGLLALLILVCTVGVLLWRGG